MAGGEEGGCGAVLGRRSGGEAAAEGKPQTGQGSGEVGGHRAWPGVSGERVGGPCREDVDRAASTSPQEGCPQRAPHGDSGCREHSKASAQHPALRPHVDPALSLSKVTAAPPIPTATVSSSPQLNCWGQRRRATGCSLSAGAAHPGRRRRAGPRQGRAAHPQDEPRALPRTAGAGGSHLQFLAATSLMYSAQ